jgi:hypothetical protein
VCAQGVDEIVLFLTQLAVFVIDEVPVGLIEIERVYRSLGLFFVFEREVHPGRVFVVTGLLFLVKQGPGGSVLEEGRIVEELKGKLFQLQKDILCPRQPLEVLE